MHCPNCGQQQVSDETKFCSRCGFPLGLVAELLAHGGFLPQLADLYKKNTIFSRRNGVVFSVLWCLFFLLIMAPLWGIMDIGPLAGASAVIGIFGGLMFLVASLTLLKKPMPVFDSLPSGQPIPTPATLYGKPRQSALPPQHGQPASAYTPPAAGWRTPDTGQFSRPGSVTDETTKLLHKEDE
jgi:hypothetical protein